MTHQIVTVSNRTPHEWYYLQKEFYKSLSGYDVLTINKQAEHPFNGLASKPKWLYKAIKNNEITAKKIIFVDNWDLVFGATPDEIMNCYETFSSPIVISAESNCFPDTYKKEYDELGFPKPYCYLNSGTIIGDTEAILTCLEVMDLPNVLDDYRKEDGTNYHSNDQTMWQEIFLKQPVKIALDYNQAITQTLHNETIENFLFTKERIMNKTTSCHPRIWHFNGGSKDNLSLREPILKHLNLIEKEYYNGDKEQEARNLYEMYFNKD